MIYVQASGYERWVGAHIKQAASRSLAQKVTACCSRQLKACSVSVNPRRMDAGRCWRCNQTVSQTLSHSVSPSLLQIYAKWLQEVNTVQVTQLERGYVDAIRRLWADDGIRLCYNRRGEYQLLDSTE